MDVIQKAKRPRFRVSQPVDAPLKPNVSSAYDKQICAGMRLTNGLVYLENRAASTRAAVDKNDGGVIKPQRVSNCLNFRHRRRPELRSDRHRNPMNAAGVNAAGLKRLKGLLGRNK